MRIVEVVHGFPPEVGGGTERYVQAITEGLRDRGHDIFVYTGSLKWMEQFTVEAVKQHGYELTTVHRNDLYFDRWDKAYNPLVAENFKDYLLNRKPDLVHVHHWVRLTSNVCMIAANAGIPVVATLHDLYSTCPRFFRMKEDNSFCVLPLSSESCLRCAERWLFQGDAEIRGSLASFQADILSEFGSATTVLAPTSTHADTVKQCLGLGTGDIDIQVLPHGSLGTLGHAPRPVSGGKLRMVYFSHLYPFKGAKLLVQAFRKMKGREQCELHLFGGGVLDEFTKELEKAAEGLDVTFHGAYAPKDLEAFPMDLVVLPTLLYESYSFILDEAAGLGVPIVASDAGAIPERACGSVLLFRRGDEDDLADKLDTLVSDRSLLEKMRAAPPVPVMPMDEHLGRLEAVYSEAVENGPKTVKDDRRMDHVKEQWERREYGFKELIRSEQWESLVASLRKRVVELEVALARRPPPEK